MDDKSGFASYIFFSHTRNKLTLAFLGTSPEEYDTFLETVNDYRFFNRYKTNLKLYSEIESFENSRNEKE